MSRGNNQGKTDSKTLIYEKHGPTDVGSEGVRLFASTAT